MSTDAVNVERVSEKFRKKKKNCNYTWGTWWFINAKLGRLTQWQKGYRDVVFQENAPDNTRGLD